jgi:hypothetical protein
MESIPRFVRRGGKCGAGTTVVFLTKSSDGRDKEISMWELVDKYGADKVIQMRREFPETEE